MRSISSRGPIVFTCVIFVIVDEYWVSKKYKVYHFFPWKCFIWWDGMGSDGDQKCPLIFHIRERRGRRFTLPGSHFCKKVARETFFLPVNKSRNIELPVKSPRDHLEKFHPWKKFFPVNISRKNAREAKSCPWSFSKPNWSRVSFRFTGKKNTDDF